MQKRNVRLFGNRNSEGHTVYFVLIGGSRTETFHTLADLEAYIRAEHSDEGARA